MRYLAEFRAKHAAACALDFEYKVNSRQDQLNYDQGYGCYGYGPAPCLDDRQQNKQFTLIAQDEIQIGANSLLTIGISHNRQEGYRPFWSPRLGGDMYKYIESKH